MKIRSIFARSSRRGFTLVETLAAISILAIAITGPMVIAQKGISSAIYARDQITSFYLAQEAVEYIRNIRDSNKVSQGYWLEFLYPCTDSTPCRVDARINVYDPNFGPFAIIDCGGQSVECPDPIQFDPDNRVYGYEIDEPGYDDGRDWEDSRFTRTIQVDEIIPDQEAVITVQVTWSANVFSLPRSFVIREHIFNI